MATTATSSLIQPSDKLLVLDLDHTLVHVNYCPHPDVAADFTIGPTSNYPMLYGNYRPGMREFIEHVQQKYKLGLWSSSGIQYINEVVPFVFKPGELNFVWCQRRCTTRRHWNEMYDFPDCKYGDYYDLKKIKKVSRVFKVPLENILMVDDSPEKMQANWGNWVPIRPFRCGQEDTELYTLAPYLDRIASVQNFRTLDKRNWRNS